MVNWNRIAGISFVILSFIATIFTQEDLMIALGLAAIYCAISDIDVHHIKKRVEE